ASGGARLLPIVSSFGRIRPRMTSMRGWKPFTSKTLKSAEPKAADGMGSLPSGYVVEREDRTADAREGEAVEARGRQPRRLHRDDAGGERLERGAVMNGRLHDHDLLLRRLDPDDADHLGVERLPAMRD